MGMLDELKINEDAKDRLRILIPEFLVKAELVMTEDNLEEIVDFYGNMFYRWLERTEGVSELLDFLAEKGDDTYNMGFSTLLFGNFISQIVITEIKKGRIEVKHD